MSEHKIFLQEHKDKVESNVNKLREAANGDDASARRSALISVINDTFNCYLARYMSKSFQELIEQHRRDVLDTICKNTEILKSLCDLHLNPDSEILSMTQDLEILSLQLMVELTDKSDDLCNAVCQIPEYLAFLKGVLDSNNTVDDDDKDGDDNDGGDGSGSGGNDDDSDGDEISDGKKKRLYFVITIVHNLAKNENNLSVLRNCELQLSLRKYIYDDDTTIVALLGFAAIMSEEENMTIEGRGSIIKTLMDELESSLDSDVHISIGGWESIDLERGILNLARCDDNKKMLVEQNCLPNMLKMAKSQNPTERMIALRCLWTLVFDDDIKKKVVDEPGMVDFLDGKRRSPDEENKDDTKLCHNILWTLRDTLTKSGRYETIGKEMSVVSVDDGCKEGDFQNLTEEEQPVGQIMMSYTLDKQDSVIQIRDQLKANNFRVWMDNEASALEAMIKAVDTAKIVIMCVSRKHKNSEKCRAAAEYAIQKKRRIIPVLMESSYKPDGWLGIICGEKSWYDFSDGQLTNSNMEGFLKAVKNVNVLK
ncbi:uncharacterized protein LOC126821834 [Patella vulgata]|uniref:uncharacterized protein LOC126821834 n=1 Tax=Patella vulgata TaxID=6465 RepID=UPI0021800BD2|nr:uncharacterized protein LOC126821834 [Patella vulgata]